MKNLSGGGIRATTSGSTLETRVRESVYSEVKRRGFRQVNIPTKYNFPKKMNNCKFFENSENQILILRGKDLHKFAANLEKKYYQEKFQKLLLPDLVLINLKLRLIVVLEIKNQESAGSVDEKLQTQHFKQYYYEHLSKDLDFDLKIFWFLGGRYFTLNASKYEAIFEYMKNCGANIEIFRSNPNQASKALVDSLFIG